jgi:hypothetical protein
MVLYQIDTYINVNIIQFPWAPRFRCRRHNLTSSFVQIQNPPDCTRFQAGQPFDFIDRYVAFVVHMYKHPAQIFGICFEVSDSHRMSVNSQRCQRSSPQAHTRHKRPSKSGSSNIRPFEPLYIKIIILYQVDFMNRK